MRPLRLSTVSQSDGILCARGAQSGRSSPQLMQPLHRQGEEERLDAKLFVGMVPKTASADDIKAVSSTPLRGFRPWEVQPAYRGRSARVASPPCAPPGQI